MTGLMLLGIALVVCACGYFIYGRWLVRLWGVCKTVGRRSQCKNTGLCA